MDAKAGGCTAVPSNSDEIDQIDSSSKRDSPAFLKRCQRSPKSFGDESSIKLEDSLSTSKMAGASDCDAPGCGSLKLEAHAGKRQKDNDELLQ